MFTVDDLFQLNDLEAELLTAPSDDTVNIGWVTEWIYGSPLTRIDRDDLILVRPPEDGWTSLRRDEPAFELFDRLIDDHAPAAVGLVSCTPDHVRAHIAERCAIDRRPVLAFYGYPGGRALSKRICASIVGSSSHVNSARVHAQRSFADVLADGARPESLIWQLHRVTRTDIMLTDLAGEILASSPATAAGPLADLPLPDGPPPSTGRWRTRDYSIWPILTDALPSALLVVGAGYDEALDGTFSDAATLLPYALLRSAFRTASTSTTRMLRLLSERGERDDLHGGEAALPQGEHHRVMVIANADDRAIRPRVAWALAPLFGPFTANGDASYVAGLLEPGRLLVLVRDGAELAARAEQVVQRLERGGLYRPNVSIGPPTRDSSGDGLRLSLEAALEMSARGPGLRMQDQPRLTNLLDPQQALTIATAEHILGPLAEPEQPANAELLRTLITFMQHNTSPSATADALAIHRHTLRYRLTRIYDLTGHDPREHRDLVELSLALTVKGLGP